MAVDSCRIEFRVRYPEVDRMGVVHHSQYAVYFELGRTELLRAHGVSYREMEEMGSFFVVASLEIRYKAPARYDDVLLLETRTARMTRARIEHDYTLYHKDSGRLLAEGHTLLACVDGDGKVCPIPDAFFAALQAEPQL
ncbi:MAG: acyl-CoA thioesterase [Phycisphaerae bacterium]|nr:acyl-CoA thioesterase [Phycisphaerae bacterium]